MSEVKQVEELLAMGGKFYTLGDGSWCDTPADSWRLVAGVGYVRADDFASAVVRDGRLTDAGRGLLVSAIVERRGES